MTTRSSTQRGACGFEGCPGCNTGAYVDNTPELRVPVPPSDADDRPVSSHEDDDRLVHDDERVVDFDPDDYR